MQTSVEIAVTKYERNLFFVLADRAYYLTTFESFLRKEKNITGNSNPSQATFGISDPFPEDK